MLPGAGGIMEMIILIPDTIFRLLIVARLRARGMHMVFFKGQIGQIVFHNFCLKT